MTQYKVGYLVGSLAKASINRLLATALVRLAPAELEMSEIPFKDLPLYSYDYDADYPPVATAFKDAIAAVDAVLFVTPEYNRSIPGGLKNAIDWASRPYGKNAFARKPSGIIGTSPGKIGTAIAQQHLRSILAFCNSPLMNSVAAYVQFERGLITDDGASPTSPPSNSSGNTSRSSLGSSPGCIQCCRGISSGGACPRGGDMKRLTLSASTVTRTAALVASLHCRVVRMSILALSVR
jgi:chromate reductase, NAD(P)H dehydrogenase (quinone)